MRLAMQKKIQIAIHVSKNATFCVLNKDFSPFFILFKKSIRSDLFLWVDLFARFVV